MFHVKSRFFRRMLTLFLVLTMVSCTSATGSRPASAHKAAGKIANPASENCIRQGGTLAIQKRSDSGEYGVCVFEDNRQCEEWALFHGECPTGGLKITGYVTLAAKYCVITGGKYAVTGAANTGEEQGTCTFKNGRICDVWDYYRGKCSPNVEAGLTTYGDPFAYCAAVGNIDTPDRRYSGIRLPDSILQGVIRQGIVPTDGPPESRQNLVWRCMDRKVWVCQFGANIPCLEKADISLAPTSGMVDYCRTSPAADNIPAYVTGRATLYEWMCRNGQPEAGRQLFKSDPRGYLADFWNELTPR